MGQEHTYEQLRAIIEGNATTPNGDDVDLIPTIDWAEAYNREDDPSQWLAAPFLPDKASVALFAKGGTGKSLFALWLAAHITTRPEPAHVLYLDYEMTIDAVVERLEDMGHYEPERLDRFHYASLPSLAPLDTTAGGDRVIKTAIHHNASLVVIDTFARAVDGRENDADTVRDWFRWTGQRLKQAGIGFLRIDHAGKDQTKGQRGSSAKNDDVDLVWELTAREHGEYLLRAVKRRYAWIEQQIVIRQTKDADEVLTYTWDSTATAGYGPGTKEVADRLDQLGAAVDISKRDAQALLHTCRCVSPHNDNERCETRMRKGNGVVLDAIRSRRERSGPVLRTTPHPDLPDQWSGPLVNMQVDQCPDHSGPPPRLVVPTPPTHGGGTSPAQDPPDPGEIF